MPQHVTYRLDDNVATITMDDGKVNALSNDMQAQINAALDQAESDQAVVVLAGRAGLFSAGFDLKVLRAGGADAVAMIRGGFDLAARLLAFPRPVTIACTGHAVAMGVFLLLSGDYRIGVAGDYKLTANEVAIGLTMPYAAVEISRQRLTPAQFNRALVLAESFDPDAAREAGFLDRVVDASGVLDVAQAAAREFAKLDMAAHASTKLRVRDLPAIQAAIETDDAALRRML